MNLGQAITKYGFQKWYERQLVVSHGFLLGGFVALIVAMAEFEIILSKLPVSQKFSALILCAVSLMFTAYAVYRYQRIMANAEVVGNQANCGSCGSYGKFQVVSQLGDHGANVHCKKCGHDWKILSSEDEVLPD
jgi:membrane-bound ClpP family serine protease